MAEAWIDDPALTGWDLAEGRAPDRPRRGGPRPGQRRGRRGRARRPRSPCSCPIPSTSTVVGIVTFGDEDSIGVHHVRGLRSWPRPSACCSAATDQVTGVIVAAADGVSQDELVRRLDPVLPSGTEAITGEALTAEMEADIESDFLGFFETALLIFAVVALLVATFSIFNTFSILVAQRTRESALLRAIGGSRRQVLVSAVVEAALVGVVAAAVGVGAGVLLAVRHARR